MSMATPNRGTLVELATLRGFSVFGMVLFHWAHILSRGHFPLDYPLKVYLSFFFPFGTQLFMALSCVSLGRRSPESIRASLSSRMKSYGWLLLAIGVAQLGIALFARRFNPLSFTPPVIFILCLLIVCPVYAYFGIQSMVGLLVLSFGLGVWLDPSWKFVVESQVRLWTGWEFWTSHIPLIGFLGYAALGVLIGHVLQNAKQPSEIQFRNILGVCGVAIYCLWSFQQGVWASETSFESERMMLGVSPLARLSIHCMIFGMIVSWQLIPKRMMEMKGVFLLERVGGRIFSIYLFHHFVFFFALLPFHFILVRLGFPSGNSLLEGSLMTALCLWICTWIAKRLKLFF